LAAKGLVNYYNETKNDEEKPFVHLTFLDSYTPFDAGKDTYGNLEGYQKYYAEHYLM
jgi:hypothetical protein